MKAVQRAPFPLDEATALRLRKRQVWQGQAIALLERALRHPGVAQESVLGIGPAREAHLVVVATERAKTVKT